LSYIKILYDSIVTFQSEISSFQRTAVADNDDDDDDDDDDDCY